VFSLSNAVIKPSRTLLFIYGGVHLLACYSLFYAAIPVVISVFGSVLVLASFAFFIKERVLLASAQAIVAFSWDCETNRIILKQKDNELLYVTSIKRKVVTPWFILIECRIEQRFFPIPVICMWDGFCSENFRRLRVLLFYASPQGASATQS